MNCITNRLNQSSVPSIEESKDQQKFSITAGKIKEIAHNILKKIDAIFSILFAVVFPFFAIPILLALVHPTLIFLRSACEKQGNNSEECAKTALRIAILGPLMCSRSLIITSWENLKHPLLNSNHIQY